MMNCEPGYQALDPQHLLDAIEALGLQCDGRMLALNSYENRVYQVGLERGGYVVAKFYRPQRWSDAAIEEEHAFCQDLRENELPVVAPLRMGGRSLHHHGPHRLALFERLGGRSPELDHDDVLLRLGRLLGRVHSLGQGGYHYRPRLDAVRQAEEAIATLLELERIPDYLLDKYRQTGHLLCAKLTEAFEQCSTWQVRRLHGDCHLGNLLWNEGPWLIDFDDSLSGPAVQDLWMLLSGDRASMQHQLGVLLEGYEQFCDFDPIELHLLEPLRALRMLSYDAWVARRWHDPAFPRAFPWFALPNYWEQRLNDLNEQVERIGQPPLAVF